MIYLRFLVVIIFLFISQQFSYAETALDSTGLNISIPGIVQVEGIGPSPDYQVRGLPTSEEVYFSMLVENSQQSDYWELTTNKPIGISISYNQAGTIMALFVSLIRKSDNTEVPQDNIRIYPSKVAFEISPDDNSGDSCRIFHFYPIVKVSKNTPPGSYEAKISFTFMKE